jgi:hypothetical protein
MISSTLATNGANVYIVGPKQTDLDRCLSTNDIIHLRKADIDIPESRSCTTSLLKKWLVLADYLALRGTSVKKSDSKRNNLELIITELCLFSPKPRGSQSYWRSVRVTSQFCSTTQAFFEVNSSDQTHQPQRLSTSSSTLTHTLQSNSTTMHAQTLSQHIG